MISFPLVTKDKKIKKCIIIILFFLFFTTIFCGCIQNQVGFPIVLIGRDSTSGTRDFFWQHVMDKEDFSALLQERNSNGGVYITVTQTPGAIGYVSLGFVDSGVKALKINNITADTENITNGKYPISRDLYLLTKGNASEVELEFIEFIKSKEGQEIVQDEGFIPIQTNVSYNSTGKYYSGTLTISGSTTVFPIIEKAKDIFTLFYPNILITVSSTGSGSGITAVSQGSVDIGMSSRDLQQSEKNLGLVEYVIGKDGIAIIVNLDNSFVDSLTKEQLKEIYKGEITNWDYFVQ